MNTPRSGKRLLLGILLGSAFTLSLAVAQPLEAPENFTVELVQERFRGKWSPVKGAGFYQVWVERFGRWSFSEKELEYTPFTSSFDLPVTDERARFRVRAVDKDGQTGPFSKEVAPVRVRASETPEPDSQVSRGNSKASNSEFDPKAPAPPPPTSLFAVWIEQDVIKLVWRGPTGAKTYSVEEEVNGEWVSVTSIKFPRKNTALIKNKPVPGPYRFRVRSVGANGRASEPSFPTTVKR